MGLNFSNIIGDTVKSTIKSTNPLSLLGGGNSLNMTGLANNMIGTMANKAMRGLLSMDPSDCPSGPSDYTDDQSSSSSGTSNDPCGGGDASLKAAVLGLGMSLAGPSIASLGAVVGGAMNTGFGAVTNAIGIGMSTATSSISAVTGINSNVIGGALGAGTALALGGENKVSIGLGILGGATNALGDLQNTADSNIFSNVSAQLKPTKPAKSYLNVAKAALGF